MKNYLCSVLLISYIFSSSVWALDSQHHDLTLREIAVREQLIPQDAAYNDDFYKQAEANNESIITWILMPASLKVKVIDTLKSMLSKDGYSISLSSEKYVEMIDDILESTISKGDIAQFNKKGIGVLFKTLAEENKDLVR